MKFPYQKEVSELFGEIFRPIVEFEIETKIGWISVLGYIDSGADVTLLPRSFISPLGIKVEEEEIKEVRGIGEGKVPIIIKQVKMKLGNKNFDAKVAIALIEDIPYILGREDVFDQFKICFDQRKKIVHFEVTR
ncbi:MAG: hypothetical protein QMC77_07225 [Methanocellales archaeon]|nr:hypothetical protein [Methanocellales archaeon]